MWSHALGVVSLAGLAAAKYDEYILAPDSRTIFAASVYGINGTVENAEALVGDNDSIARFAGPSTLTLDFGVNIAGLVTVQVGQVDPDQYIGLAFSESSLWITSEGSDATADAGLDEVLWFQPTGPGNYTPSPEHVRGGFRYLTLIHNTTGSLQVEKTTVHFTAMPHVADDKINDYKGWFHSNDELVNRVWYAGAYTNQLCTIDPKFGNSLNLIFIVNGTQAGDETPPNPWYSNSTISNGTSVLVDGAKRDRLVWAGDMAIAVPGIVVSYDDLGPVANSLDSLFNVQDKTTGLLPYAGVPFPRGIVSFTYHLYTLIGVADYYLYSASLEYLQGKWAGWKKGMEWSLSSIDDTGLMNVTSSNDWLRSGMGGHNIEANAILYYTLNQGISLGKAIGEEQSLLDSWTKTAEKLKDAANSLLWDDETGMFKDNETTTLAPQDGNSWSVKANLTTSDEQKTRISKALAARWGPYGAPAVEAGDAVSPFISGFELQAHALAANASAALDLIRLQWGFMMDDPRMTNSTFIEGYSVDGSLHYAPYTNDPRISHAHGWASGPTSTLTFYIAGIHLTSAGGKTWELSPRVGDLTFVDAGFQTSVGSFASQVNATEDGRITGWVFTTPDGTTGRVSLPGTSGSLRSATGTSVALVDGAAVDVPGGTWTLVLGGNASSTGGSGSTNTTSGAPAVYTGGATSMSTSLSAITAAAVIFAGLWSILPEGLNI